MTSLSPDVPISVFSLVNSLLRRWRIILVAGLAVATVAVAARLLRPKTYVATASFLPQQTVDMQRSGLAALAGQFGIGLGGPSGDRSPKFYVDLFQSHEFLAPVVRETLTVAEQNGLRGTLADLYALEARDSVVREAAGVGLLIGLVNATADAKTGVVAVSVASKWPSVSATLANRLIDRVNDYNLHVRQSQGAAERRFVSKQLESARETLRAAEDRQKYFLQQNRQCCPAPGLKFENDRLERDVMTAQQIVISLTQAHEDAKIREVRDTPVITVVEPARAPFNPKSRRLGTMAVLGFLVGAIGAMIAILLNDALQRRRRLGDPDVEEFVAMLRLWRPARGARAAHRARAAVEREEPRLVEAARPK